MSKIRAFLMDTTQLSFSKITLFVLLLTLYACGGQSPTFNGGNGASSISAVSSEQSSQNQSSPNRPPHAEGKALYDTQCAFCHGASGQGAGAGGNLRSCSVCTNEALLIQTIDDTMPLGKPQICDLDCSTKIAKYILAEFVGIPSSSTPAASSSSDSDFSSQDSISSVTNSKAVSSASSSVVVVPVSSSAKSTAVSSVGKSLTVSSVDASSAAGSSVAAQGDAVQGKKQFEGMCIGCHKGGPASIPLSSPGKYTDAYASLATYITNNMLPFVSPAGSCDATCVQNIAAYIRTRGNLGSSSSAGSSVSVSSVALSSIAKSSLVNSSQANSSVPAQALAAISVQGNKVLFGGKEGSIAGNSLFWSNTGWGGEKYYTAAVVKWLKDDWKSNLIRAAMGVEETGGFLSDAANKTRVETVVDAAIANNMYVIIDWHTHKAENYKTQAIDFFKQMATKYGNYNNVIYEVYNEPLAVSWDTVIKPYAQDVIAAIRAIDPDNLIIVGTPNWSQDVDVAANNPITAYSNIAYTLHFYAGTHKAELRAKAQTALDKGLPLFVTEWGAVNADGGGGVANSETTAWLNFLKTNKISHANWALNDKAEGSSSLVTGASANGGWTSAQLTASGALVKDAILNWPSLTASTSSAQASSAPASSKPASSAANSSVPNTGAGVIFTEDFESGTAGTQPAGWSNLIAYNFNGSNTLSGKDYALIDTSDSFNGSKSIHFKGNFAQLLKPLPANTQRLHMRAWVKSSRQIGNIPGGDTESNHSHIMGIKKTTDANNEIRVGEIKGTLGTNDVPSDNIAPKSDKWRQGDQISADKWICVEVAMYADTTYDELYMWVDSKLVHSITSANDWQNGPLGKDWLSDKFNYVEFGFQSYTGQQTADVWMDDIVVSTQSIGCGNVSSVSSAAKSSVANSSVINSSVASGDPVAGKSLYDGNTYNCALCHGATGKGTTPIDATKLTYGNDQTLAAYIAATMPKTAPGTCTGACATNLAAYIRSWVVATTSSSSSNSSSGTSSSVGNNSCGVTYGPRNLRVLTRNEFANAMADLTGVSLAADLGQSTLDSLPADNIINGFSNNVLANIESGALQSYGLVVNKVVERLAAQNFAGVINCSTLSAVACGEGFVNTLALRIFRRPLTTEEKTAYQELFAAEFTGGDVNEGIKLALRTALTSPQFLYRSEVGISAADVQSGNTGGDAEYEPTGTVQNLLSATKEVPIYQRADGSVNFTGNDLLEFTVSATQAANGVWPTLQITANTTLGTPDVLVNHATPKTYRIQTSKLTGNQYIAFVNQPKANPDNGNLTFTSIKISGAKLITQPKPPVQLDTDAFVLTPYELASYLSFTFAGTTPDVTLLSAAASGGLITNEQIAAQVERLTATANARKHFGNFAAQWLRTDRVLDIVKDNSISPKFTDDVRKAMAQEVRDVFTHVVLDEGEVFTKLYDGNFTFVNQALADFYGISGVSGTAMKKVTGVTNRAGLVTSGAFMTVNAHEKETGPILRSVYLRRNFLCHDVPAPPTGISLDGTDIDAEREKARVAWEAYLAANGGKATSRRHYEFLTSASTCKGCHDKMINPLGGGMEDFDAFGLPQVTDFNGLVIDAVGTLFGVTAVNDGQVLNFTGAKQIAHEIAGMDVTRQCFIDNGFRLAMGTGSSYFDREKSIKLSAKEIQSYSCEMTKLDNIMKTNNNSTKALLKGLGNMDSVRYRKNVQR
jgi:mono/diheme cytochrome c family protein